MEIVFLTGMLPWTAAFVIFGILMIRGQMPTWLGIVLIVCAFLPAVGAVPAWYYIGAIVLGVTGLVRFRENRFRMGETPLRSGQLAMASSGRSPGTQLSRHTLSTHRGRSY